jgi:hypothetical protein
LSDQSRVVITSSHLHGNKAFRVGGAVYAHDQAEVHIMAGKLGTGTVLPAWLLTHLHTQISFNLGMPVVGCFNHLGGLNLNLNLGTSEV